MPLSAAASPGGKGPLRLLGLRWPAKEAPSASRPPGGIGKGYLPLLRTPRGFSPPARPEVLVLRRTKESRSRGEKAWKAAGERGGGSVAAGRPTEPRILPGEIGSGSLLLGVVPL